METDGDKSAKGKGNKLADKTNLEVSMHNGIMGRTCHTQVHCSSISAHLGGDDEPRNIFFSLAVGITQHFPTKARMPATFLGAAGGSMVILGKNATDLCQTGTSSNWKPGQRWAVSHQ